MTKEKIKQVMGAVLGVDASTIGEDASPGNIEAWDSMRHMYLILAFEEEFGVRFDDRDVYELVSFKLIELALRDLTAK